MEVLAQGDNIGLGVRCFSGYNSLLHDLTFSVIRMLFIRPKAVAPCTAVQNARLENRISAFRHFALNHSLIKR